MKQDVVSKQDQTTKGGSSHRILLTKTPIGLDCYGEPYHK